jgi:hypothetical protein
VPLLALIDVRSVVALSAVGLFVGQELAFGLLLLPGVGIGYATAPTCD